MNKPFYLDLGTGFQTNGNGYNFNFKTGTGYKKFGYLLSSDYIKIGDIHGTTFGDNTFDVVYQKNTFNKLYEYKCGLIIVP